MLRTMEDGLLLCAVLIAVAALTACGLAARERIWARMETEDVRFGAFGQAPVPKGLRNQEHRTKITGDYASFEFLRVHDSHINGTTSYAEELEVAIFAPDLAMERIQRGGPQWEYRPMVALAKDDIVEQSNDGKRQWKVTREIYERDPVREPSWRILLLDRERRILLGWRGFRKQYKLETAKANLLWMLDSLRTRDDLPGVFGAEREWPTGRETVNFAANRAAVRAVLGAMEEGAWTRRGPWRYTIDRGRPQVLVMALLLGSVDTPDGPVDLRGPVTKYRYVRGHLWEDNQGSGGGRLSQDALATMPKDWVEPGQTAYYSVQAINLWQDGPIPAAELIAAKRKAAEELHRRYMAGELVVPAERR